MVPYALGQKVDFVKNNGPKLSKFVLEKFLEIIKKFYKKVRSSL